MIREITTLSSDSKQVIDIILIKQQKNGSVTSRKGEGSAKCDDVVT